MKRNFLFLFLVWVFGSTVAFSLNAMAQESEGVYTYDPTRPLRVVCSWRGCAINTPEVVVPSRFSLSLSAVGDAYGVNDVVNGQGSLQLDMRARLSKVWGIATEIEFGGGGPVVESSEGHAGVSLLASWQNEVARVQLGLGWQAMFAQNTEMVNAVYLPLQADFFLGKPTKSGAQFFLRTDFGIGTAVWRSRTTVDQTININPDQIDQALTVNEPDHVGGVYYRFGIGFGVTFDFKKK